MMSCIRTMLLSEGPLSWSSHVPSSRRIIRFCAIADTVSQKSLLGRDRTNQLFLQAFIFASRLFNTGSSAQPSSSCSLGSEPNRDKLDIMRQTGFGWQYSPGSGEFHKPSK